jgi:glycosyltransferase involved in cell wall biosynthesis
MIEALAIIKRAEPRILLRLVGVKSDDLLAKAMQRADAMGVRGEIELSGWLPHREVAYAMKTCMIGLVPLQPTEKYKRSLPIKLLEYMACGLPVVAANLPLIERYVRDSSAGLLYDSTRPEELARCVLELLGAPDRRQQMGEHGLDAVRQRWNWDRMEEVLLGVYESMGARLSEDPA